MPWAVRVELIEAASRAGMPDRAAGALRELTEPARAAGTDWALGILARCRALCSDDGEAAQAAFREAIERLGRTPCVASSLGPTCSTANGCAARTAG